MVDVRDYDFNIITAKTIKPEKSFINSYVGKCFGSESAISATSRMCRILDSNYKNSDLNKVMTKKCQHLKPEERKRLLNLLRKL